MTLKYHVLGILLLVGACEGEQLSYNAVDVSSQIGHIYVEQVMGNFARILENKGTLPSQATLATGLIQVTNSVAPSVTFPLSHTFASAVAAVTTRTTTTAGAGMTLGGSVAWQQQFGIIPIGDPFTLRNLGFLYRTVLYADCLDGRSNVSCQAEGGGSPDPSRIGYQPPRIYDRQDNLVPDPYYLQPPLCVLCLNDPDVIPEKESDVARRTHPNDVFRIQWLYWRPTGSDPNLVYHYERGNPVAVDIRSLNRGMMTKRIGQSGGYFFYEISDSSHNYFENFVLLTLPPSPTPARFSRISTDERAPKGTRGKNGGPTGEPGSRLPQGAAEGAMRPNILMMPQMQVVPQ
jgi:hypothetical protein